MFFHLFFFPSLDASWTSLSCFTFSFWSNFWSTFPFFRNRSTSGPQGKGNIKEKNSKATQSCPILNTNAQQIFGPINFIRVLNLFGVINPVPTLHSEHIPQIAMFPPSSHLFKAEKQKTLFFCGAATVKIFRNCCFEQNVRNFFRGWSPRKIRHFRPFFNMARGQDVPILKATRTILSHYHHISSNEHKKREETKTVPKCRKLYTIVFNLTVHFICKKGPPPPKADFVGASERHTLLKHLPVRRLFSEISINIFIHSELVFNSLFLTGGKAPSSSWRRLWLLFGS